MPVVDASVVVDWVAPKADAGGPSARLLGRLTRTSAALYAPRLLIEEVGNALLTGVRKKRWSGQQADEGFSLLRRMPVSLVDLPGDALRAWDLSRRFDEHPFYDMIYVAVAERLGEEFLTADRRLCDRVDLPFVRLVS